MEGSQKLGEGSVTGARGDGVKTKNVCEDVFSGPPGGCKGVVNNYFSENSSDLGHYFLPPPPEISQITGQLETRDPGYHHSIIFRYKLCNFVYITIDNCQKI